MNEQFESLAKAIFDHENSGPDCPAAPWDQQGKIHKNRYRAAAMACCLITLGPVYRMEMAQPVSSETAAIA